MKIQAQKNMNDMVIGKVKYGPLGSVQLGMGSEYFL